MVMELPVVGPMVAYSPSMTTDEAIRRGTMDSETRTVTESSAVIRQDSTVECHGVPLFVRKHAHGLSLTQAGRQFLTHAQKVLAEAAALNRLADNISGKTMWCQMFSEPGAGSDVASLQSRAVLDGDEWILNGQKVCTTYAHMSDYGIVIARTDPNEQESVVLRPDLEDQKPGF